MKILNALLISLVFAHASFANFNMKLGEVHADEPAGYVSNLYLVLGDDHTIVALHSEDNQGVNETFSLKELSKGAVVFRYKGMDAIAFDQVKFDPAQGGTLQLNFMRKFKLINKDFRTIRFSLEPNTTTNALEPFLLYVDEPTDKKQKDIVTSVSIFVERTLGIVTGVQEIQLFNDRKKVRDYDPSTLTQVPNLIGK